jgi:hypothetical protein
VRKGMTIVHKLARRSILARTSKTARCEGSQKKCFAVSLTSGVIIYPNSAARVPQGLPWQ